MIQEDVVIAHYLSSSGPKLNGPTRPGCPARRNSRSSLQVQILVTGRAGLLDPIDAALGVIEGFKNQRRPEVALVDQIARLL